MRNRVTLAAIVLLTVCTSHGFADRELPLMPTDRAFYLVSGPRKALGASSGTVSVCRVVLHANRDLQCFDGTLLPLHEYTLSTLDLVETPLSTGQVLLGGRAAGNESG